MSGVFDFFSHEDGALSKSFADLDVAFIGPVVDDRGDTAVKAVRGAAARVCELNFDPSGQQLHMDGKAVSLNQLANLLMGGLQVGIDATTLGLAEILSVLLVLKSISADSVDILYIEPKEYVRKPVSAADPRMRDFSLTQNCRFIAMQGFAQAYLPERSATHVFLLGYEPSRLLNAIEERNEPSLDRYKYEMVIGVPAFNPGWEADSLRPHLEALAGLRLTERSITYCQANSIRGAYSTLWDAYDRLGDEGECFYVSPLGTKPHAVGSALFLMETKGAIKPTALYYDHPQRKHGRSSSVGKWHHIHVRFQQT